MVCIGSIWGNNLVVAGLGTFFADRKSAEVRTVLHQTARQPGLE
jgi:hypothetical protein